MALLRLDIFDRKEDAIMNKTVYLIEQKVRFSEN